MNREDIVRMFTYRKWSDAEVAKYSPLRKGAMDYALLIEEKVPPCPERDEAIHDIHRVSMLVNLAVSMNPMVE